MYFFISWIEVALFLLLMSDMCDDLLYDTLKFDIFQYDVTRVSIALPTYLIGLYFGRVRIGYLFVFIFYLLLGSNYTVLPDADLKYPLLVTKIIAFAIVATSSISHHYQVNGPYGVGYREFKLKVSTFS